MKHVSEDLWLVGMRILLDLLGAPSGDAGESAVASVAVTPVTGPTSAAAQPEAQPDPRIAAVLPGMKTSDIEAHNLPPIPLPECHARLASAGVTYKDSAIRLHRNRSGEFICGAKQVVRYKKGPGTIRYNSSPKLTCKMAVAMAGFEKIVQDEAVRIFGRRVVKIQHIGTYNCRGIAAYEGWVSQHSFGNAIDIKTFTLKGGREISVKKHYGRGPEAPKHDEGKFLRAVVRRFVDEKVFSVVVTPNFDRAHHNHFHLDLAPYSVDGT
ncbi:MAG: extensin family protein [Nannocystaceae bacterium]